MSGSVSADSLRVTEVSTPTATRVAKEPIGGGDAHPAAASTKGGGKDGTKAATAEAAGTPAEEPVEKDTSLGLDMSAPIASTPPPPADMLVVDTSGLRDAFMAVTSRLDGHDSQIGKVAAAVERVNAESKSKLESLEKVLGEQVTAFRAQLAEESQARATMLAQLESRPQAQAQNIEETEFGKALLDRIVALETKQEEHTAATADAIKDIREVQALLQAEVKQLQSRNDDTSKEIGDNLATIHQRLAKVELSITSRIGGLVAGEETEKKRSGWKKKKMTLMMVAQSSVKAKAELKRQEAELEEARKKLEVEEAAQEREALAKRAAELEAQMEQMRSEIKVENDKLQQAQMETETDPDDSYSGPSIMEMIQNIESGLKRTDARLLEDLKNLQDNMVEATAKSDQATAKIAELEKRLKKQDGRQAKREAKQPKVESPPTSPGGTVDAEALGALEERLGRVEEDFEVEVGALQDDLDGKLDEEEYKKQHDQLEAWREETDTTLKAMADAVGKAQEMAAIAAQESDTPQVQEYDDTKVIRMVEDKCTGLDRRKFDREEAYLLEQELSASVATVKEEVDRYKGVLLALEAKDDNVDQAALDALAAAIKAKMMAMGNAFHKRFEDLEEQLLGVGSSATRSSVGLCLSCSRPTSTVDHVVRPASPSGSKAPPRPSSRQGSTQNRYFHKASLYSNTFDSTEGALLAAANEQPQLVPGEASVLNRPRTHHGERVGGLAPLGRPMESNHAKQIADGNSFNLSGISTASPILDAPFRGNPRVKR